jgi:hypothetical protein
MLEGDKTSKGSIGIDLQGANIVVLDLECLHSPDDCLHCGKPGSACHDIGDTPPHIFQKIGWENKVALGLAIGCYWDYQDMRLHFFDRSTLAGTMRFFVDRSPLLVSFNGTTFDFALMRALLRHEEALHSLCDAFKSLCAQGYDVLQEIWKAYPESKLVRGLNGLDAIAQANGLGKKAMDGATAPRLWAQGRIAEVVQYCAEDVRKTRVLFELACGDMPILRSDGKPIMLPRATMPHQGC